MTTTQHAEIETKFEVDTAFAVPDLSVVPGVASVGEPVEHALDATYYDTPDLRLTRARVTLRRRTGGSDAGWHVKLPVGKGVRRELRQPLGRAVKAPPKTVLAPVEGLVRRAPVSQVVRLQTRRLETPLLDHDGRVLAQLADDRVTATTFAPAPESPAVVSTWREVEIELVDGDRDLLDRLGAELVAAGARPSGYPSKVGRALRERPGADALFPADGAPVRADGAAGAADGAAGAADGARVAADGARVAADGAAPEGRKAGKKKSGKKKSAAKRQPPPVTGATAADVVVAALRGQFEALQTADVMIRTDQEDGVHQVRVACRRLRSILAAYRSVVVREVTDPVREELRWLGSELSDARDREVALDHLREVVGRQPVELVLGPVAARLQQADLREQIAGREQALRALGDSRYFRLLDNLAELVADPPLTEAAGQPAGPVLTTALAGATRRLRHLVRDAEQAPDPATQDTALHGARKAAKRLRYTAEVAGPVIHPGDTWVVDVTTEVQDVLGARQDTVITRKLSQQFGVEAFGAGENAWTYGRLHALEEARAVDVERQFWTLWTTLAPRLHELQRAG